MKELKDYIKGFLYLWYCLIDYKLVTGPGYSLYLTSYEFYKF